MLLAGYGSNRSRKRYLTFEAMNGACINTRGLGHKGCELLHCYHHTRTVAPKRTQVDQKEAKNKARQTVRLRVEQRAKRGPQQRREREQSLDLIKTNRSKCT